MLEELNRHLGAGSGLEDLLSLLVAVISTSRHLRYASAGHCTNMALIERELIAMRSHRPAPHAQPRCRR